MHLTVRGSPLGLEVKTKIKDFGGLIGEPAQVICALHILAVLFMTGISDYSTRILMQKEQEHNI